MTQDVLDRPAYQIAAAVRAGEVSPAELVAESLARIQVANPDLNAVISLRAAAARAEAAALVDHGQPFFGVPLLLKGLGQQLAGLPDTGGAWFLRDAVARKTNNFVATLQEAGFIILGQTNFPEFGFKNVTDSRLYGDAHNPWNLDYTPGGSSGGAAAAVMAGLVPIAAASDGGGSIRIPASWTGTIGLKPTRGRVVTGPDDWRSWQGAAGNFALTRSVVDTALLLDVLQAVQPAAVFQVPRQVPGFAASLGTPLKPGRIGYTTQSPVGTPVAPAAIAAVESAARFLSGEGFAVEEITLPTDGEALMRSYYQMNAAETAAMFTEIEATRQQPLSPEEVEPLTWALYQTGKTITAADYSRALTAWDRASYQMATLHEDYPLILSPTTAQVAPRLDTPLTTPAERAQMETITELAPAKRLDFIATQWQAALTYSPFTQQANLTGEPAISLPTTVTPAGLPLGVQLVAAKGQEALLLKVAKRFEEQGQFRQFAR